jgi:cell division protein FtsB
MVHSTEQGLKLQLLAAVLIAVLVFLHYLLWIDEDGVRQTHALSIGIRAQTEENAELAERNRALAAEVEDLKGGLMAIEEQARSDMGMIRPDETFYRLLEKPQPATPIKTTPPPKPALPAKPSTPAQAAKPASPAKPSAQAAKPGSPAKPSAQAAKPAPPAKPSAPAVKPASPAKPATQPAKPASPAKSSVPAVKPVTQPAKPAPTDGTSQRRE